MPTTAPGQSASRNRRPYSEYFRELGLDERQKELTHLKKLYDQDRMSIRQIARLKRSSYGFMHAKLVEAGANIGSNRPPRPIDSAAIGSEAHSIVTARHDGRGTRP